MKDETAKNILEKTVDDYNRIAEHFAQTRTAQWPAVVECIKHDVRAGDKVCDLGCGNGRVAESVQERKAHYVGLDVAENLIAIARRRYADDHNVEFHVGSMLATPFADATFDVVLMIASFHHLPSRALRKKQFQECYRILKNNGIFVMLNWNLWQPRFFAAHAKHFFKKIIGRSDADIGDLLIPWKDTAGNIRAQRFYHGVTQKETRHFARITNFHIIEQYYENGGKHASWWHAQNLVSILQKE